MRWGDPIPFDAPGVYIVSTPSPRSRAPIDKARLKVWIERVPGMSIDGRPATSDALENRLRKFWIPDESVVYIGLAGTSVATRVRQFYRTPLGDRGPHAGGHWLKTLEGLDTFLVTWARSETPDEHEGDLLALFAQLVPPAAKKRLPAGPILPFANLEATGKLRKAHGIRGSTRPRAKGASVQTTTPRASESRTSAIRRVRVAAINTAIQSHACNRRSGRVTAVEAAAHLDRLGILRDSPTRRGKPLRDLMRAGLVAHAFQEGRFWFVDCAQPIGEVEE